MACSRSRRHPFPGECWASASGEGATLLFHFLSWLWFRLPQGQVLLLAAAVPHPTVMSMGHSLPPPGPSTTPRGRSRVVLPTEGRSGDPAAPAPCSGSRAVRELWAVPSSQEPAKNWGCEDVVLKEGPESLHQRMPAQGENPLQPWGHVPGREVLGRGGGTWGHSPLLMYVATSSHTGR